MKRAKPFQGNKNSSILTKGSRPEPCNGNTSSHEASNRHYGNEEHLKRVNLDKYRIMSDAHRFGKIYFDSDGNPQSGKWFNQIKRDLERESGNDTSGISDGFYLDGVMDGTYFPKPSTRINDIQEMDIMLSPYEACNDSFEKIYRSISYMRKMRGRKTCARSWILQLLMDNFIVKFWKEIALLSIIPIIMLTLILEGVFPVATYFPYDSYAVGLIFMVWVFYDNVIHSKTLDRKEQIEKEIKVNLGGINLDLPVLMGGGVKDDLLEKTVSVPRRGIYLYESDGKEKISITTITHEQLTVHRILTDIGFFMAIYPHMVILTQIEGETEDLTSLPGPNEIIGEIQAHANANQSPEEILRAVVVQRVDALARGGIITPQKSLYLSGLLEKIGTFYGTINWENGRDVVPYTQKSFSFFCLILFLVFLPFSLYNYWFTQLGVFWYVSITILVSVVLIGFAFSNGRVQTLLSKKQSYSMMFSDNYVYDLANSISEGALIHSLDTIEKLFTEEIQEKAARG